MAFLTLDLSDSEITVVENLALEQEISATAIMRQALRLYQLVDLRAKSGETFSFSGDQLRLREFTVHVINSEIEEKS